MRQHIHLSPTSDDWGDISDPDVYYAFEHFGGKSNQEMQSEYRKNVIERCENLRHMPINVFRYYIVGLAHFIESGSFGPFNKPDSVNGFFDVLTSRIRESREELKTLYVEMSPFLRRLADNQLYYEADLDIYGDFSEILDDLDSFMNE